MANEENRTNINTRPPRGPMGGGRGERMSNPGEKAKDFKGAVKRLFKELDKYRLLLIVSLLLAIASAFISTIAPDKLSNLANSITKGLQVNTKNVQILTQAATEGNIQDQVIDGVTITSQDKLQMLQVMSKMNENATPQELYGLIDELTKSVHKVRA